MKKFRILFLIVFVLFFSFCSLTNEGKNIENRTAILGSWDWQESRGGISGKDVVTPEITGVRIKLVFKANDKVSVFTNGLETASYTYKIVKGKSVFDNKEHYLLTFNEMCYVVQYIDKEHLTIKDNFADGYVFNYVK